MLIYARNQTFCSKSVNKAPIMLIFDLNTLCGILSDCTVEPRYNEVLGTMKITLLYQVSNYIRVKNKEI